MNQYPPNWPEIARAVKDAANWKCIRCAHPHSRIGWRILTVHRLDTTECPTCGAPFCPICEERHVCSCAERGEER